MYKNIITYSPTYLYNKILMSNLKNYIEIENMEFFDSIVKDVDKLIEINVMEKYKNECIEKLNNKVDVLHNQLNNLEDNFVKKIFENFDHYDNKVASKVKSEARSDINNKLNKENIDINNNELNQKSTKNKESIKEKEFHSKISEIKNDIDININELYLFKNLKEFFNNNKLIDLLNINKDKLTFKLSSKLRIYLYSKEVIDLEWKSSLYSKYIDDEKKTISIFGNKCYTYYLTDKIFNYESIIIDIKYKAVINANYFYLGFINSNVNTSSNCMCCTIKNAVYLQPNGNVVHNNKSINYAKLIARKNDYNNVCIKLNGYSKEVFFNVNNNEDVGPFNISGQDFKFVSGSCNSINGSIEILDAYYI